MDLAAEAGEAGGLDTPAGPRDGASSLWERQRARQMGDDHAEPKTAEEIAAFQVRWNGDPEGFEHRWSVRRFSNVNIARDLSPAERAQRDREKALLSLEAAVKPKKASRKKAQTA